MDVLIERGDHTFYKAVVYNELVVYNSKMDFYREWGGVARDKLGDCETLVTRAVVR